MSVHCWSESGGSRGGDDAEGGFSTSGVEGWMLEIRIGSGREELMLCMIRREAVDRYLKDRSEYV